ncbi:MAG: hypothetical protein ABIJ97_01625 [Bacteroidota bacterium]
MSWINDIDKLSIVKKSFVISIPILMPFWYLSIYLFHYSFFQSSNQFYIPFVLTFCLAFCWYLLNIIATNMALDIQAKIFKREESNLEDVLLASSIVSIGYLCLLMLINYFIDCNFIIFIFACFAYIVFKTLWTIVSSYILLWFRNKKNNNKDDDCVE